MRLIVAVGMKCGVELKSQGRSTVTEMCPSDSTMTSAMASPAAVPMTASARFSIITCSPICRHDQPMACRIAISRRRSATDVAVARHTKAAANRPMMAAMISPMLCDRNSTPDSALRIDSSLDTTPFLPIRR